MAKATQQVQITVALVLDEDEANWLKANLQNPLANIPVPPRPASARPDGGQARPLFTMPDLPEYEDDRDRRCRSSIFEALRHII